MDEVTDIERIVMMQGIFKAIDVEFDLKTMIDDWMKLKKSKG